MSPESWERLQQLLAQALELPAARREAWLRAAAGADHELLATLRRLLETALEDETVGGGLLAPPPNLLSIPATADVPPARLDDFEILEELGRGSMGIVHRARQRSLNREVALKRLMPQLAFSAVGVERFRLEATAHARLRHPNIVSVHVVGEDKGTHFFAMDHVPGASLREVLAAMQAPAAAQPEVRPEARALADMLAPRMRGYTARVATLVATVADALEHSHQRGLVHRDVKPGNILIDLDGVPHVTDFGVAKDMQLERLLQTDHAFGTPHYMSPEQAGERSEPIDRRTDIYSLGVVLYELLTLRRPFEGDSRQQVLRAIREREPTPPSQLELGVHRDLQTICLHALEKQRGARYPSAAAMADDLRRFLAGEPIRAVPPGPAERVRRWLWRRRLPLGLGGAVVAAAAVSTVYGVQRERSERLSQELQPLVTLQQLDDAQLDALPGQQLVEAQRACARLLASGRLDEDQRAAVTALDTRIAALGRQAVARADALVSASTARRDGDWRAMGQALAASAHIGRGALLLPDDREVQARAEGDYWLPRLSVVTTPPGARVTLQRLDPVSGNVLDAQLLAQTTPIEALPVEVDYYRILAEIDGLGFAEASRALVAAREVLRVELVIRPTQEVVGRDMALVAGGPVAWGEGGVQGPGMAPRRDALPPFWIDRYEVSNGEYRQFVQATGHREPAPWSAGYDPAWDRLPVAYVSFADAEAYAAWAGKRLPTAPEWLAAARGPERVRFPWGDDAEGVLERAVLKRPTPSFEVDVDALPDRQRTFFAAYLAAVLPVDSLPQGASAVGVHHAVGNVREWTESPELRRVRPEQVGEPLFTQRVVYGGDWRDMPILWDLTKMGVAPADQADEGLGFRCAKSHRP